MARLSPLVFPLLLLLVAIQAVAVAKADSGDNLVRKRREWIIPPRTLKENNDYTSLESIARIRSDFETDNNIEYSLEGVGANMMPYHVFVVESRTGNIRVTKVLDREDIAMYNLSGIARYRDGTFAEKRIDVRIKVEDENDCPPVFGKYDPVTVAELSPTGFSVTTVIATDADEPGNINSKIAYTLINQEPSHDMFSILPNGTILVNKPTLDRETADQYILTVRGQDLDGRPGGNIATGTVTVNILDVNDNPPTLEKEEYEGSIMENVHGVEVMRIKAEDLDLEDTPNWEAVFDIVKGNEAGYFSIKTDPETNEGILMLDKPVDYEDVKNLELGLTVENKAPLYQGPSSTSVISISGASAGSGPPSKTYPIKISVKNQPEGPSFVPEIKTIPIPEGGQSLNINDVIAIYPATDGDTQQPAENIRYAKGLDPDNWFTIDQDTAEIRLNKIPDRESPHLVNGTYYAKVLGITEDIPAKTVTGTIAIQVQDLNDHCPILTSDSQTICSTNDNVIVVAKDEDISPNGPPFKFSILPKGKEAKWQVEHLNGTAAILRAQKSLWPGSYEVMLDVKDQQGFACSEPQKVRVDVCTCEDGVNCAIRGANGQPSNTAVFGPAGIGLLLLGLLLLLLVPLMLLFCQCGSLLPGTFIELPFDTKSQLISYHTEGQGEDKAVPLLTMAKQMRVDGTYEGKMSTMVPMEAGLAFQTVVASSNGMHQTFYQGHDENWGVGRGEMYSECEDMVAESGAGRDLFNGMALSHHFLSGYYTEKLNHGYEDAAVKDSLLVYDHEDEESSAGSVGCCSLLETDNNLQFLDDLGPKFKTLAEVCGDSTCQTAETQMSVSLPTASVNAHSSVSSLGMAQQLPSPPQSQPFVSKKTEHTMVKESSEYAQMVKESTATMRQGASTLQKSMAGQGQMLLLQQQQPVYYTTTPVLQPMQYVVQPQVQNTVLLAEAPVTNMQGMVLVNSTHSGPTQGVVVQGQTVMSSGQLQGPDVMLMERNVVQGGGTNLINAGNVSGSQTVMAVEGKVPSGSVNVLKGSQACLVTGGTLQSGKRFGAPSVLVVGGPTGSGEGVQEAGGLFQTNGISGAQRVL